MAKFYTVTSKWADGMVVKSRPMSAVRVEAEYAALSGYRSVLQVNRPVEYRGRISRRDWALITEDALAAEGGFASRQIATVVNSEIGAAA